MPDVVQAPSYGGVHDGVLRRAIRALTPGPLRRWAKAGYATALDFCTGGRGLARRLPDGEVVRVAAAHRGMSWNLDEYAAFRAATRPGATVFDVGANAGAYSLLFGQWVGSAGKVFAFEPSPRTRDALARHVALNGLAGVVEPVAAAAADRCGEADLTTDAPDGMHRLAASPGGGIRVPATTLDTFCAARGVRPNVVKIDVEGHELAVLRGARETLRAVGTDLEAFVEIHPSLWPEVGVSRDAVAAELSEQGLEPVSLRPGGPVWTVEGMCLRLVRKG